jgi:hypothetical protein
MLRPLLSDVPEQKTRPAARFSPADRESGANEDTGLRAGLRSLLVAPFDPRFAENSQHVVREALAVAQRRVGHLLP